MRPDCGLALVFCPLCGREREVCPRLLDRRISTGSGARGARQKDTAPTSRGLCREYQGQSPWLVGRVRAALRWRYRGLTL